MGREVIFRPQPGPQEMALASGVDILVCGGAAGGGKTWVLLYEPTRHRKNPKFGAVIFRRTFTQIMVEGGMWDEATEMYPYFGATPNKGRMEWVFPSGARIRFAHLQYEKDLETYQGAQIAFIGFDQVEQFTERQFFYMLTRNRSLSGVRPYVRASCNPDPDSYIAKFINWWIADDGFANLDRVGKIRYFVRISGSLEWADTGAELVEKFGVDPADPKSVTFLPSSVYDNKILLAKNPGYLANLKAQSVVDRERLLGDPVRGGNWKIRPMAGKVFNRSWFEIVDKAPDGGVECRFWDFAATEKEVGGSDPAYTAGVKMRKVGSTFYVLDCIAEQVGPVAGDRLFSATAQQDVQIAKAVKARHMLRWEIEPGSSGKKENARLIRLTAGIDGRGRRPTGDKLTRAKPLAIQAEAGNVKLVRGAWNERWLTHMHNQPETKEKDIMDASSGAFNELTHYGGSWRG